MDKDKILKVIEEYIKKQSINESSGHDWWHIKRVENLSLKMNASMQKNEFVIIMIALLHDIFDDKFSTGNAKKNITNLLKSLNVYDSIEKKDIENILFSIENLGFKGGFKKIELSDEGKIVQDADRIDAIGAIGIARCFAYNGKKGNPIYDPDTGIIEIKNENEYRNLKKHAINHFYEKLLKLKDTINTDIGKNIAIERTKFMEQYLKEFYDEWDGKK